VFVTEPFEYNLSCFVSDNSMKEFLPGELEIKCIILELLEGLNFLHSTAKTIHNNLAPENVYVTKNGKVKLGGLNFAM
jgi:SCY1-like protein 2